MSNFSRLSIGVSVFIRREDKILVGTRGPKCKRGAGLVSVPGGVNDQPETFIRTARREAKEETGLDIVTVPYDASPFSIPGLLAVTDHMDPTQVPSGRLVDHMTLWLMTEPTKCLGWEWVRPAELAARLGDACENPTHEQYEWVPMPLWRKILRPYFGVF